MSKNQRAIFGSTLYRKEAAAEKASLRAEYKKIMNENNEDSTKNKKGGKASFSTTSSSSASKVSNDLTKRKRDTKEKGEVITQPNYRSNITFIDVIPSLTRAKSQFFLFSLSFLQIQIVQAIFSVYNMLSSVISRCSSIVTRSLSTSSSAAATSYVLPPQPQPSVTVYKSITPSKLSNYKSQPSPGVFPVRRIFCIGRNYAAHVEEMGGDLKDEPFFFMKPAGAIQDTSSSTDDIFQLKYSTMTSDLHWEAEFVIAVGKEVASSSPESALASIYGFGVGNDLTRRDLQNKAKGLKRPWDDSKGFDDSAQLGGIMKLSEDYNIDDIKRFIETEEIILTVNGEIKQQSALNLMIWKPLEIITTINKYHKLLPGDLIYTGTPAGVGGLEIGDVVEVGVNGVGGCRFKVIENERNN